MKIKLPKVPLKLETITKFLLPFIGIVGSIMLLTLILMFLWNAFLVGAVGVATLTFGQAILGWMFIYFLTVMFLGAKQLVQLVQLGITMLVFNRQMKKLKTEQDGLLKHFKNFMKEN